jgi:hypothetical protein
MKQGQPNGPRQNSHYHSEIANNLWIYDNLAIWEPFIRPVYSGFLRDNASP